MKKTILTLSVITLLIACSKSDDTPTPVATTPTTTPIGGGSNADGELIAVIVEGLPSSWTASTLPSSHPSYYNAGTITNVIGKLYFNGSSVPNAIYDPNNTSYSYSIFTGVLPIDETKMTFTLPTPIALNEKWSTGIYDDFRFDIYDSLTTGLEFETTDQTIGLQNSLTLSNQNDTILGMTSQGQTVLYLQNLKIKFVVHWN